MKRERDRQRTYVPLLQPSQRLLRGAPRIARKHLQVARALHRARRPKELHGHDDEPDEPQHQHHEGAQHDDGRQQAAVGDEQEDAADEDEGEGPHGDVVRKVPAQGAGRQLDRVRCLMFAFIVSFLFSLFFFSRLAWSCIMKRGRAADCQRE